MDKGMNIAAYLDIQPVRNMSDFLYQKISGLIMNGTLPEGYAFPNEAQLCEQLNVGRSTLREAYKALELTGYVSRSKREGTVVNGQAQILAATPLKKSLESAEKNDFNEYRMVFESANAARAAERGTDEEIADLTALQEQMEAVDLEDETSYDELQRLDKEFHFKIAHMTHNDLFAQMVLVMGQLWDEGVRKNFFNAKSKKRFGEIFKQHRTLIAAIAAHDQEAARRAMETHIEYVIR